MVCLFFFFCAGSSLLHVGFLSTVGCQFVAHGLPLQWPLLLQSIVLHGCGMWAPWWWCGPSGPAACGIFLDQGCNRCPLHCKADY